MTRCPHCFQRLAESEFVWTCASGRCPTPVDEEASALHGAPVGVGPVVRVSRPEPAPRGWKPPVGVDCPSCSQPAKEACPRCRYPLPVDWRDGEAVCIAMAGARATGKSVYVGVLVKQVAQLAERLGTTLVAVGETTAANYTAVYERALFEQRGLIAPTPSALTQDSPQREPLIYSLGVVAGRRRYLVLRDVAGEDLEAPKIDVPHLRFFRHADGVIFMFDPLRVPEISDQLQDLVPAQLHTGGDPATVLAHVLSLVGDGPARIAVVLSKFDAMQALRSVSGTSWNRVMSNPGAAFQRDVGPHSDAYDDEDGQLVHQEVDSLLQRLGAGGLVTSLKHPDSGRPVPHRFFAVSALGEPSDGNSLHLRGISSFRCLDPLRWLLAPTGAL